MVAGALALALGSLLALALGSLLALALGSVLGLVHTLYSALYLEGSLTQTWRHAFDTAKDHIIGPEIASAIGPVLRPLLCTRLCDWHSN